MKHNYWPFRARNNTAGVPAGPPASSQGEQQIVDRLADFTQDRRVLVLSAMAVIIGVASAFVAYALVWLIGVITNLAYYHRFSSQFVSPAGNQLGWWAVLIPTVAGLIIGLMARYGSEQIRGHGIPEALEAILIGRSRMKAKVAVLKPLSSAISIGAGGPFGAEGPIIMTGGAFGSLFAQLFDLSPAERKTLLVAGAAGGMAAIFATPVAATILAVELLLFEWRPRSFIPVALASVVAAALRVPLLGRGPIFPVPAHSPLGGGGLAISFGVGLVAGLASALLTVLVYALEDLFHRLPIHWMWWPVLGGLIVGIGGMIDPHALGVGYDNIHALLMGQMTTGAAVMLLIVKGVIWAVALGSGTSGGVLAPLLIMGGALGLVEGRLISPGDPGLWAMISMAALMGGTMRSPLTAVVFTLELTHDLNLLPALLVGCVAAHAVTVLLMRRSILTEKVARRGHHLVREYTVDPLRLARVKEVMDRTPSVLPATLPLATLADMIAHNDPELKHQGMPIVDDQGKLIGIITRGDVLRSLRQNGGQPENNGHEKTILEAGSGNPVVTYPDELLYDAVSKMLAHDIGRLPVVDRRDPHQVVGYLGRADILRARQATLEEEASREPGLLHRPVRQ